MQASQTQRKHKINRIVSGWFNFVEVHTDDEEERSLSFLFKLETKPKRMQSVFVNGIMSGGNCVLIWQSIVFVFINTNYLNRHDAPYNYVVCVLVSYNEVIEKNENKNSLAGTNIYTSVFVDSLCV